MRVRRDDKRQEILRAAEHLCTDRHLHEITLDEVARVANVGKGTIYLHFADKDDLFFQVATSGFDDLCQVVGNGLPVGVSFRDGLLEMCGRISGFFQERRQVLRMMQTEESRLWWHRGRTLERWQEHRGRLLTAVAKILAEGVDQGLLAREPAPRALAAFLLGMLRTRSRELDQSAAVSVAQVVDLFLHGAGPAAESGTMVLGGAC